MKNDQKTRKKNIILPNGAKSQKLNSGAACSGKNRVAILCQKHTKKNVGKKEYSNHFLKLLQSLHETAKKEGLKVVPFSAHITAKGLIALNAECERRNENLASVIHQRYSKALQYRINRKPVFFFTLGFDNPLKVAKGKTRNQPKCYTGVHTHGFVLVTESESDGRTRQGQAFRKAFKTFNGNVQSESFKQQEVSIATASKIEHYETKYTTAGSVQRQADYLAKNARQFTKNFKDSGKPYSASKTLLNRKNERIHETITIESPKPKPKKETFKDGATTTPSAQLVLTEQGLIKPPPVSDSLKRKIAEWNKQLTDNPESATAHAPPPPPKQSLDDMIKNL